MKNIGHTGMPFYRARPENVIGWHFDVLMLYCVADFCYFLSWELFGEF